MVQCDADKLEELGQTHGLSESKAKHGALQDIGGPITRSRAKAMKKALNGVIQELKEWEALHLAEVKTQEDPYTTRIISILQVEGPSPRNTT